MTMWMLGTAEGLHLDADTQEVRFWVEHASGTRRLCRLSYDALATHPAFGYPEGAEQALAAARLHFDRIADAFLLRLERNELLQADGSLRLERGDL